MRQVKTVMHFVGIPIGAKPPVSNMLLKIVIIALIILAISVILVVISPSLLILVEIGIFVLAAVVCITVILGLYDSAREALKASEKERASSFYNRLHSGMIRMRTNLILKRYKEPYPTHIY